MIKIIWKNEEVPPSMKVKQVYGIVFNKEGRLLLKVSIENGKKIYSFAGGRPENFDKDRETTLKREFIEEINTTLSEEVYYLGYQEIQEDNITPFAQVRMTAMVKEIGEKRPDPDNGETYDRIFVSPQYAIDLLGWGEVGKAQIEKAMVVAGEKFNLKFPNDDKMIYV